MLLVFDEKHKEHLAFVAKAEAEGEFTCQWHREKDLFPLKKLKVLSKSIDLDLYNQDPGPKK